jgi:hypothetical protein
MKQLSFYFLLISILLTLSCQKEPIEAQVDAPVQEPLLDDELTHLPLPPEGCKITKTTYKGLVFEGYENRWDPEIITLDDGQKVPIQTFYTNTYTYDQQGRIEQIYQQFPNNYYSLQRFTYTANQVSIHFDFFTSETKQPTVNTETMQLNERGLRDRFPNMGMGQPHIIYNQDDQVLNMSPDRPGITHVYEQGNLVAEIELQSWGRRADSTWFGYNILRNRVTYETRRPNLPVIQSFYGRSSRNLPLKEVKEQEFWPGVSLDLVYQKTHTYHYDQQGQVRRRITHGKRLKASWPLEDDPYGVGVTDFEYECPK